MKNFLFERFRDNKRDSSNSRRNSAHARWDYTQINDDLIKKISKNQPSLNKNDVETDEVLFLGRPTIGRDRAINGGIYINGSELVVVDDQEDLALQVFYQELINRRRRAQADGIAFKNGIFEEVFELAKEKMPYDAKRVAEILEKPFYQNKAIFLSKFFGGGVCRHQALFVAYLFERLIKEGKLRGQVSVDRSYKGGSGHAWVRYTNSAGEIFIFDPASNYTERLTKIAKRPWDYKRPEEEIKPSSDTSKHHLNKIIIKIRQALGLKG